MKKFKLKDPDYLNQYKFVIKDGIFYAIENNEFERKDLQNHLTDFANLPDYYKVKAVQVGRFSQTDGSILVQITPPVEKDKYDVLQANQYKYVDIKQPTDFDHR